MIFIFAENEYERAKVLVEGAAESGLPDAMLELEGIYNTGKGVKQDHREIIKWLKKPPMFMKVFPKPIPMNITLNTQTRFIILRHII